MTTEAEEMKEFISIPTEPPHDEAKAAKARRVPVDPDDCDDGEVKTGDPVQYARMGAGYIPTTATVSTLPSGVYRIEQLGNSWVFMPHHVNTDELIALPDSRSTQVVEEIRKFWTLKTHFAKFGFKHKRGFLLWGPQGSGKTSTVDVALKDLVQTLEGVVILGNTYPAVLTMMLLAFRKVEPDRPAVVVLEDIDALIGQHGETEILALLDGEASIDNVCYLATTNYPEKLDPRVKNRPSRFDRVVKIGMPSPEAREAYLKSRGLPLSEKDLKKWVDATQNFSIAHIKELIIGTFCYGARFEEVLERIRTMSQKISSSSSDTPPGIHP